MHIDIITIILFIVLAFVCGYSCGHKVGRQEGIKMAAGLVQRLEDSFNTIIAKRNETRESFIKLMQMLSTTKPTASDSEDKKDG